MTFFRIAAALAGALLAQAASAQTYPSKPVTLVVPFAAGGGTDIVARLFAERLREPLKQNVIVENRPGASAQIGNRYVVEAAPEDLLLKRKLFAEFEQHARPDTILASNTSVIPITSIMEGLRERSRALGTHWWNPPYLVPLVEVIETRWTSPEQV